MSELLQPANVAFAPAAAVSVTEVFCGKKVEQVPPQLTPAGLLVTVPVPAPAFATVSWKLTEPNVAVTLRACDIDTVHVPTPGQLRRDSNR